MPVMAGRKTPLATIALPRIGGDLRLQLEGAANSLLERFNQVRHVKIVATSPDLIVLAGDGGYRLYQQGGVPINEKPVDAKNAVARAAAEPDVRRLVTWSYPGQRLPLELELFQEGRRTRQGFFLEGQQFNLMLRSGNPVWPLVLDVDVTGHVTVLYPREGPRGTDPVVAGQFQDLGLNGASCPCGIEFLKAFAFVRKPTGYGSWARQSFPATDSRLMQILALAAQGMAEGSLRLITNSKN